jgi:malate dehydrogenase (quinone)
MVDFGALTKSFLENSIDKSGEKKINVLLNAEVERVKESNGGYELFTKRGTFRTSFVSFDAGSYSLYFAKSLGYAKNLILLLIGGSFYYSRKVLNGKVYRVQKGHIPFSATHGDVDILTPGKTRFGPTVSVSALLEKGHPETFINTIQTEELDFDTLASLATILGDKDMRTILERNAFYHVPYFGKHAFLDHEVRKIVPSLGYNDLEVAKGIGGVRPQIIDKKKRKLELGESIIRGQNAIFNITPSPGATVCLQNAFKDTLYIVDSLGKKFDDEKFNFSLV